MGPTTAMKQRSAVIGVVLLALLAPGLCLRSLARGVRRGRIALCVSLRPSALSLAVPDVPRYLEFYSKVLRLPVENNAVSLLPDFSVVPKKWEATPLDDEFRTEGFVGIGVHRVNARSTVRYAAARSASTERPLGNYSFGASLIPDEDEKVLFPARYTWMRDPWGMRVEVTENPDQHRERDSAKVVLKVLDLDKSINFYRDALGLKLFRRRSNVNSRPRDASLVARLGSDDETRGLVLELVYAYATETVDVGQAYQQMTWVTDDLKGTAKRLQDTGVALNTDDSGALALVDPSGYQLRVQ